MAKIQVLGEELFPGIPNELTLNQILTKVTRWREIQILSSVNRGWLEAIRSRQVYEARVFSNSTESLAVIPCDISITASVISLYSLTNGHRYDVPPIPHLGRIPGGSGCVSLDGKLYVLGGWQHTSSVNTTGLDRFCSSNEVYVLDLATQRQWERCASMLHARAEFGCGVVDGKIYVFGGMSSPELVPHGPCNCVGGSEVYDPSVDEWSAISPMPGGSESCSWVATGGEELFVLRALRCWHNHHAASENDLMAYRPALGEWRIVSNNFSEPEPEPELMFMAKGQFYSMLPEKIVVYDVEKQLLGTEVHSFSSFGTTYCYIAVGVVGNELLATVESNSEVESPFRTADLFQSNGFGSGQKEIVWNRVPCSGYVKGDNSKILPPLNL